MINILMTAIGALIGYLFALIDCVLYALYLHPEDETSSHLIEQLRQHRYKLALQMVIQMNRLPKRYIHKSVKFLAAFAVLGIFVVSSTTSFFARGLVIGFGVYTIFELVKSYSDIASLRQRYMWDLSPTVSDDTVKWMVVLTIVVFATLSGLALL
ncbi:MAG TPA: hypothetical protein VFG51_01340 [Candidatus Saccharimonadia bacterium]|nr:hypothetical protein [Candidatus Saccharimonadia bacterium]